MNAADERRYDCCLEVENYWFRYRTGAIIVKDNKMLFVKSMFGGYYYMIGGGVHLGENSKDCIEREVFEESGARCTAQRPAIICENLFIGKDGKIDGKECHVLEFYYLINVPDDAEFRTKTDDAEELVWVPVDEICHSDIRPAFLKGCLKEVIEGKPLVHVINDERQGRLL